MVQRTESQRNGSKERISDSWFNRTESQTDGSIGQDLRQMVQQDSISDRWFNSLGFGTDG